MVAVHQPSPPGAVPEPPPDAGSTSSPAPTSGKKLEVAVPGDVAVLVGFSIQTLPTTAKGCPKNGHLWVPAVIGMIAKDASLRNHSSAGAEGTSAEPVQIVSNEPGMPLKLRFHDLHGENGRLICEILKNILPNAPMRSWDAVAKVGC